MKDYLQGLVRAAPSQPQAINTVREYLQARMLGALQRERAMIPLSFQGGTALRFIYNTSRYSEDLDFSLERNPTDYDFRAYIESIQKELAAEGYEIQEQVRDASTVNKALVKFPGLLFELGLTSDPRKSLRIKLEVDTNPPAGAVLQTSVISRYVALQLQHHDQASLFAGKLHAVLSRKWLKGRDIYDLVWYLSYPDWPSPNLELLNNALHQTGWEGRPLSEKSWRKAVRDKLNTVAWDRVESDVRPFLMPGSAPEILTRANLLRLLR